MAGLTEVNESLLRPACPPTDVRGIHLPETGRFILEEFTNNEEAWLYIDDQHFHSLEAME